MVLTKTHPGYKHIQVTEIDDNYLLSDKNCDAEVNLESDVEEMDVDEITNTNITEREASEEDTSEHLKRLALGDVHNTRTDQSEDDDELEEDNRDARTKYNIGTDTCVQPCDFNHFVTFDKDPHVIAPAEKNKLSSLLTDRTIEALAFPHLFPDGHGSYNEERQTILHWKEYCKVRLFSSDPRFGGDSSYIFFLQYLSDLKQVFTGINVAFRKRMPMNVQQCLDDTQIKFLLNKDMIYRHLQCVRGSPQFWNQRLKQLFGMSRQLDFNHLFLTFSCADLRWKEFTDAFVRYTGGEIKEKYTYEEKTNLLRACPVVAARMFEKRFNTFMNLFITGGAHCLGKVTDWFIRIEMQLRGSPHAHMPLWVENAPIYKGPGTDEKTREEIVKFCDCYITTRFPSLHDDPEVHNKIVDFQTHSRNHSKACLKCGGTICKYSFPRPVSRRTFICEPISRDDENNTEKNKKIKQILTELNITLNELEKEKTLSWEDFDNLLAKYNWTYEDYGYGLRVVHTRPTIIHKREPNARWVNQYNEELLRAWDANMDIQFVLDPYACAKYIMSYTTKPEREMSLLLEATHKECREGNMSVRDEMKKLTGTFFNHRQVSVQKAIYRATKMPLTYCSRGFVFVPAHSSSCRFLKSANILKQMDPEDKNVYMSNLADKYFDRPADAEFDICMAKFASEYEITTLKRNPKKPRTAIKRLQTLNFAVKRRCSRKAIIRFPHFNRQTDKENYYENLLCLYLPIRSRDELQMPYELFYQTGEVFDKGQDCMRKVKDIVQENQTKYEAHFKKTEEVESIFHELSKDVREEDWAMIVAKKGTNDVWSKEIEEEDNPDFNKMHNKRHKGTFIDFRQRCMSTDEMRPLLDSMNEEQQEVFYRVRQWCTDRLHNPDTEPLRLFITGGAGTGKSHLLKCLHYEATKIFSRKKHLEPDENIDEIHTLITAFTGAAAVNVGGVTIHSAFGIGSQQRNVNESLSSDKLNMYRCKLGTLKLLFVDEVSLIQADLWGAIHSRLTQIMGIHSNSIIFGNVAIIAIGDFYQCSPVASPGIYSSLLWTDHFESVELTVNERQKTNKSFSQMLNRIRKRKKKEQLTEEDQVMLQKCHQRYLNKEYHPEALHLFARNAQVDVHNEMMIEKICTDIRTFHELDRNDKEMKSDGNRHTKKGEKPLRLARNARAMITKNLSVNDGLANGVVGRILNFVENDRNEVSRIVIQCDSPRVGRLHRLGCLHCQGQSTVCVGRETNTIERFDFDSDSKKGSKQFPLRLSWAMTIHKAQGITVDEIVVSTKELFGSGMGYTAFSRVRTLNGLFLIDLHLDKFYCNEKVEKVLSQMREMKKEPSPFQDSSESLNVLFHNVEGLRCNLNALRNHRFAQKANLICLVETWLRDNSSLDQLQIDGYHLFQKPRSSSFESTHPIQAQKGGGVAIYVSNNLSLKRSEIDEETNLEYFARDIENINITIITSYRSPQQPKREFIVNMEKVLKQLSTERKVLLVGDFNENTLDEKEKPIERKLEELGLMNMYKGVSTTNGLSSLDCVYTNFAFTERTKRQVTGTYFSFHDALIFSINFGDTDLLNNKEFQSNADTRIDTEKSTKNSPVAPRVCSIINKRKHQSDERTSGKVFKSTTTASSAYIDHSPDLKRKQLVFLQNHKERRQIACEEDAPERLDFSEQLALNGLKKKNVPGDGNCFFYAVSYQLHGHQRDHMNIRQAMINYLVDNMTEFAPYIHDPYESEDDYIDQMCSSGTYADHLAVLATAIIVKKNIIIHEIGHRPVLIPGSDFIDHQIHLCYGPEIHHYDATISLEHTSSYIAPENMLLT